MTNQLLEIVKDEEVEAELAALRRAARMARELAVRTNTSIIIVEDGKLVRVTADELRKQGYK